MEGNWPPAVHTEPGTAADGLDYVSMDDGGIFTYHSEASDVLACFEYTDEAGCILDREGFSHRILAGPEPRLSGAHGTVDFAWLREQWKAALRDRPGLYRVRRFQPGTMQVLLADLFETLEVDQREGLLGRGVNGYAQDPYGHLYRVISSPGRLHRLGRGLPDPARGGDGCWCLEVERR